MNLIFLGSFVCIVYALAENPSLKVPPAEIPAIEQTADYWLKLGQKSLEKKLAAKQQRGIAKNLIIFVGNGLSAATTTAARTLLGQQNNQLGEETVLSFDTFPYTGVSKTYCVNAQVADAACAATATFTGVKSNIATIGLTGAVPFSDCEASKEPANQVTSILAWAQLQGKATGFVTTGRVTSATPAATYAHTPSRFWECDADVLLTSNHHKKCADIAKQLVESNTGKKLNIIYGGGRNKFLPKWIDNGCRLDDVNLINQWSEYKFGLKHEYVYDKVSLAAVPKDTDYVLGLFAENRLPYNAERDPEVDPSLSELVESAIKFLGKNKKKGFVLVVDAANIDYANDHSEAQKALDEAIELNAAVEVAKKATNKDDTLISVVVNHAHTLSISGYPARGNSILGIAGIGFDLLPYSTLSYATGPGYKRADVSGRRYDIGQDDLSDSNYKYPTLVPLPRGTHGGSDVTVYAKGPWAFLVSGVNQQSDIPAFLGHAACIGPGASICEKREGYEEMDE